MDNLAGSVGYFHIVCSNWLGVVLVISPLIPVVLEVADTAISFFVFDYSLLASIPLVLEPR